MAFPFWPLLIYSRHLFPSFSAGRSWPSLGRSSPTGETDGRLLFFYTSTIRHGRQALNQNLPGGSHAVSNHDRRLVAEAGMAGRAQHAVGALEIIGGRARARQARRDALGRETAGGRRH